MGNDGWKGVWVAATVEKSLMVQWEWIDLSEEEMEIGWGETMEALQVGQGRFDLIGFNNASSNLD